MFTIRFETLRYRPDLQITIRTEVDGWGVDLAGEYEADAWVFRLSAARYGGGFAFKFVLEEQYWMSGGNLALVPVAGGQYFYKAPQVSFPEMDAIVVENGQVQRRFFQPEFSETKTYDAIVIGSGIGGGIVADQLADLGRDVLVLEAGSYLFPTHAGNLPRQHLLTGGVEKHLWGLWDEFQVSNTVNTPGSVYEGAQGFNLGGRSVFWGGLIPRMTWWEAEPWPENVRWYLEGPGYQLAEALLGKAQPDSGYLRKARAFLQTRMPRLMPLNAPMAIRHTDPGRRSLGTGIFSTADLLMESRMTGGESGAKNLKINLNHPVVALDTQGDRVVGVVAHDLISDVRRTFKADKVVLAAGTIESAKIAMLSGLRDPTGQVGAGLTDHPVFFTHFWLPTTSPLHRGDAAAKILLRHRQAGPPAMGGPAHRYNVVLELGADFNHGRFVDPDILEAHLRARGDAMICEIVFLLNAPLVDTNKMTQGGPSYAKPLVSMQPCPVRGDEVAEMEGIKDDIISALGGKAFAGGTLALERAGLGGVAHEVGTLRMGMDKVSAYKDGVVDDNLKYNGYDNLFVCDLSVFPTSPAANPTLTLAALALRLADHLALGPA